MLAKRTEKNSVRNERLARLAATFEKSKDDSSDSSTETDSNLSSEVHSEDSTDTERKKKKMIRKRKKARKEDKAKAKAGTKKKIKLVRNSCKPSPPPVKRDSSEDDDDDDDKEQDVGDDEKDHEVGEEVEDSSPETASSMEGQPGSAQALLSVSTPSTATDGTPDSHQIDSDPVELEETVSPNKQSNKSRSVSLSSKIQLTPSEMVKMLPLKRSFSLPILSKGKKKIVLSSKAGKKKTASELVVNRKQKVVLRQTASSRAMKAAAAPAAATDIFATIAMDKEEEISRELASAAAHAEAVHAKDKDRSEMNQELINTVIRLKDRLGQIRNKELN